MTDYTAIRAKYADEDINLTEEFGSAAITGTKHGVIWMSFENNLYLGHTGSGEELLNTNSRESACFFVAAAYIVEEEENTNQKNIN